MRRLIILTAFLFICAQHVSTSPVNATLTQPLASSSSNEETPSQSPTKVPDFLRSWKTNPNQNRVSRFWEVTKGDNLNWFKKNRHVQLEWSGSDKFQLKSKPFLSEFNQQLEIDLENLYEKGYLKTEVNNI